MTIDSTGTLRRPLSALLFLTVATVFAGSSAFANSEDIGQPVETTQGTGLTETTGLSDPAVTIDFDALATGPTSLGAITSAYPGSALASLTWSTQAGTGEYSFQMNGNALAPNPDGSGGLYIVSETVDTTFGNPETLTIGLSLPVTEFGFDLGDWSGPFNITAYSGATQVGTLQVDTSNGDIDHFFQSASPFDEVRLSALPDNPQANWAISGLYVPQGIPPLESVPTLSPAGIVTLTLIFALLGLMIVRSRSG